MNEKCCLPYQQRMLQPSSHQLLLMPLRWALRELKCRQTGCPLPRPQPLQPPQHCTLGGLRMGKNRILAPDSWGAYQGHDFNKPRLLHSPIHRKALNSLTWDVWSSLINSNLLMFWLLGLFAKNPIDSGSSVLFGAISQSYPGLQVLRKSAE